jgi:putative ABC transport system permease protein
MPLLCPRLARLVGLFRGSKLDREMDEEMQWHLEMETERNCRNGMSPDEARCAARRQFGGLDQLKERERDARTWTWPEQLAKDCRFAFRSLAKSPGFTIAVVATLALGIGATTAMVSIARQALLPSLPFPDEKGLVAVEEFNTRENRPYPVFAPQYAAFRAQAKSFVHLGAQRSEQMNLVVDGQPSAITALWVTPDLLPAFGLGTVLGRTFTADDYRRGSEGTVVLLSYQTWQQQFGGDQSVIGREINVGGRLRLVVGVMPTALKIWPGNGYSWNVCLPLAEESLDDADPGRAFSSMVGVMGRLKQGVTSQQAQAELAATRMAIGPMSSFWAPLTPRVIPIREKYLANASQLFWVFLGAVACLYAISCANAVNLMLVRTVSRRRELGVRLALGGSRLQLVRLLLAESMILAAMGGAFGLLVAKWGYEVLGNLIGAWLNADVNALDRPALLITLIICLGTGILLGLVPALRIGRANLQNVLKEGVGSLGDSRRLQRLRSGFVVVQAALATMLLIGGGLMMQSVVRLQKTGVGFDTSNTYTMWACLPFGPAAEPFRDLSDRMVAELKRLPGVQTAAQSFAPPMKTSFGSSTAEIAGRPEMGKIECSQDAVGPEYFSTIGQPLRIGRGFAGMRRGDPNVVVINDALARRLFPHSNPLGQRLSLWGGYVCEIIGVVADVHEQGARQEPLPHFYLPFWHSESPRNPYLYVLLRLAGKPAIGFEAAVRKSVYSVDPRIVTQFWKLEDGSLSVERGTLAVLQVMSTLALLLATMGLFAVMAYAVAQRKREFGVRIALGATPDVLLRMVLRRGLALAALGVAIGLAVSWGATRFLQSVLYETSPYDPATYAGVTAMLLVVAAAACWFPARRAARVDPMAALRAE